MTMKINSALPRTNRRERGQSLVELAISLTVILLLLAGAVDFGMALFSYVAIRDAAQEGALYGSLNPTDQDGIRDRVRATSTHPVNLSVFDDSQIVIEVIGDSCEGLDGAGASNGIRVTVGYDYPIIMPYIGAIVGGQTIPLHAQVTDTILTPRCP
jgi:Flp pilus assembly protein TadG